MKQLWIFLNQLGSPPNFWRWSQRWMQLSFLFALITAVIGFYGGLVLAPADYLQGESFRIIYIHVPAAVSSMSIFVFMAIQGAAALIWRIKICEIFVVCAAPIGAMFTALTLATGMLWGKPTWGTYWTWDARLTSELILLFLYLGVIALNQSYADQRQGARASSVLALIGVINVPIIHYSVQWWNTLHQGETITLTGSKMHASMLWPLLLIFVASKLYFLGSLLLRARVRLLEQESEKQWVREALNLEAP